MTHHLARGDARRPGRAPRALVRAARVGLLLIAILIGSAAAASAHNNLERSDPPNGGLAAVGRTELTLWFGEPVDERTSSFTVRRTDPSPTAVQTTVALEENGFAVRLTTPPLQRGTYSIEWAVVGDDGHPTSGTVAFGAGVRPDGAAAQADTRPSPWNVGLRLADLGGLLVAIGALAVSGRVLRALGDTGRVLRPRVLRLGAVGALVSVVAAIATPVLRAGEQVGPTGRADGAWRAAVGDLLLGSTWGTLWLLRILVGAVACVALWRCGRDALGTAVADAPTRRPRPLVVAAVALVVSAGLDAWAGHAATLPARTTVAIVAGALHVLAAGVWAGGLLVVLVGLRPVARLHPATRRVQVLAALRAYSPMAALAAGVLAATGIYLAGRHVQSLSTVSASTYGTALLAKSLLLAVALGIAAYNTLVVNPALADRVLGRRVGWRPDRRRLATTATVEAGMLVVAVAAAALMTTVPTAKEVARADVLYAPAHATVDGLFVTFEAVPTGSSHRVLVRIEPVIRPVAAVVTGVDVGVTGPSASGADAGGASLALHKTEEGRYEGSLPAVPDGDWQARLVLHRTWSEDSTLVVPWSSGTADRTTGLERTTSALALLLLLGMASVLALVAARRRPSTRAPRPDAADAVVDAGERETTEDLRVGASRS